MHRSRLKRLQEMRQIEADLGSRLLTAKTLTESARIRNEWMAKHVETIGGEQKTFTTAWLGLLLDAMATPSTLSSKLLDRDHKSEQ